MVGYKLNKFAPLGVKGKHQAVEMKRRVKEVDCDNGQDVNISMKKRLYERKDERGLSRQTHKQTDKQTRLNT